MKQIILLVLTTFSLSAQVKGVVLDSISGKPIAYVGVFTSKPELNFSADEKGEFKKKNFKKTDTLWFFTTGYEIKKVLVKDLKRKTYLTHIQPLKQEIIIASKKNKTWFDSSKEDYSLKKDIIKATSLKAYYLNGIKSTENEKVIIESINVMALNISDKKAVYKIRFFESDSVQNIGKEITNNSIIEIVDSVKSEPLTHVEGNLFKQKRKGFSFAKINLLEHQIIIPKEGLFVAFEIINIEDNFQVLSGSKSDSIMPFIDLSKNETKTYKFERGNWILEDEPNYLPKIKISITQQEN